LDKILYYDSLPFAVTRKSKEDMILDRVGVLGATSLVGDSLSLLLAQDYAVVPFSRRTASTPSGGNVDGIPYWISLMPILALPDYLEVISAYGGRRIVALSSTSVFTKKASSDLGERALAAQSEVAEQQIIAWAESHNVEVLLLRPTLIYGRRRDRNIGEIARFIRRFGFFPVFGAANGLRQPIYVEDVALACRHALEAKHLTTCSYNISGGETLTYRDMVSRIFETLGQRQRIVTTPLWLFSLAVGCARILPRFRNWSVAMAERMNQNMVFDHTAAERDLRLSFRPFRLEKSDLPI
jgi:nucleoside-diphosphate-sugar epimerase